MRSVMIYAVASQDAPAEVSLGLPAVANHTNIPLRTVPTRSAEKTGLATRLGVYICMCVFVQVCILSKR